jgi:hypothetical protein
MNKIEKALSELRKEPQSENRDNVLDQFRGVCLCCCDELVLEEMKLKLHRSLMYYGFNKIAEDLT